jgi:hypothetical protein
MSTLKEIRNQLTRDRAALIFRQKKEMREFKEKQLEERHALYDAASEKTYALYEARRQAKEQARLAREEKIRARQAAIDARLAAWRAEKEAAEKLHVAAQTLEALGFKVEVKTERIAPVRTAPPRPLSWWQQMLKDTGKILSDAGVELLPGNRDVRLLAVFCHFLRNVARDRGCIPLTQEQILGLARNWHENGGRAGVDTPQKRQAWFARVLTPPAPPAPACPNAKWREDTATIREMLFAVDSADSTAEKVAKTMELFNYLLSKLNFLAAQPLFRRAVLNKMAELRTDERASALLPTFAKMETLLEELKSLPDYVA